MHHHHHHQDYPGLLLLSGMRHLNNYGGSSPSTQLVNHYYHWRKATLQDRKGSEKILQERGGEKSFTNRLEKTVETFPAI